MGEPARTNLLAAPARTHTAGAGNRGNCQTGGSVQRAGVAPPGLWGERRGGVRDYPPRGDKVAR